jgi:hypothetical protein
MCQPENDVRGVVAVDALDVLDPRTASLASPCLIVGGRWSSKHVSVTCSAN